MKNSTRTLIVLFTVLLAFSFVSCKNDTPAPATGTDKFADSKFTYTLNLDTNSAQIDGFAEGYDCPATLSLPSTVEANGKTYTITNIGANAFSGQLFSTLTLPEQLVYIGGNAFYNCTNITSVVIPASVKDMKYSFRNCRALRTVTFKGIPDSLTNPFQGVTGSTLTVNVPNGFPETLKTTFPTETTVNEAPAE